MKFVEKLLNLLGLRSNDLPELDMLIVGLGNPGKEYEETRHNVGFKVIEALSEKYNISLKADSKFSSIYGTGEVAIDGENYKLTLAMPTTYMNNSGFAISKLVNWFKLDPKKLIVVHDEVAIDLGKIRISHKRGAGGHHGIESAIKMLGGSQDFSRIRIGVGPDPGGDMRADFVLSKFTNKDKKVFEKVCGLSIEAIEMLLSSKPEDVMNKFNGMEIVK